MFKILSWRLGLLTGILASAGMLTAVACAAAEEPTPTSPPTAGPKRGGIVRQMGVTDPVSFDAHNASASPDNVHNAKLYNNLVWNPNGDIIEPDVAERWEVGADGLAVTYYLHGNVRFHDGRPLTARDVKFSLEKIMGLADGTVSPRVGTIKEFIDTSRPDRGVEVVDDYTVRLHLAAPSASLNYFLATGFAAIIPEGTTQDDLKQSPHGSGPYKLKNFQRGSLWEYERNNDYFKPGLPYVDELQVHLVASFAAAEAAFITGQVDLNRAAWSADNQPVVRAMVDRGEVVTRPYSSGCLPQGLVINATKPPFNNPRVRQAINLAIDRKGYIEVVHNGRAEVSLYLDGGIWGLSTEEIWQLPGFRQPKDQDLAEAQRIMQEEYPDGLKVELLGRNSFTYSRQAEFFAAELAKIGIEATINLMDRAQLFPTAQALNYEIWSYYFCQTTGDPDELFGGYFITGASRNWLGYSNPRVDEMYLAQSTELDPARRKTLVRQMEQVILQDLPIIPTAVHTLTKNNYSYVKNVPMGITSYTDERLEQIWLDK